MQGNNDDDKSGAGGMLTQAGKTIVQVAVRTGGDAVAAQGAVDSGMAAFDISGGKCSITAVTAADAACAAFTLHTDAPRIYFSKEIGKQAHRAIGCAVGHHAGAS